MTAADPPRPPCLDLLPAASGEGSRSRSSKPRPRPKQDEAVFTAQVIGQSGVKRGLKGGPSLLKEARSVYLETEYSGPNDRRPPAGRLRKTEV